MDQPQSVRDNISRIFCRASGFRRLPDGLANDYPAIWRNRLYRESSCLCGTDSARHIALTERKSRPGTAWAWRSTGFEPNWSDAETHVRENLAGPRQKR